MTIEQLAPYLPYGLRVQSYRFRLAIGTLYQLNADRAEIIEDGDEYGEYFDSHLEYIKPYFRPFSSLVKEVELDGKRIVPAVEIAKLATTAPGDKCYDGKWRSYFEGALIDVRGGYEKVTIYDDWNVEQYDDDEPARPAWNQYAIHQLLRRLHFAPPGLGEDEYIAIDEEAV